MRQIAIPALFVAVAPLVAAEPPPSPLDHYRRYTAVEANLEAGRFAAAVPLLEKLVAAHPDDGELRYALAYVLLRTGREAAAVPHAEIALATGFAPEALTAYRLARVAARSGEPAAALEWLERALEAGYEDRPDLREDEAFAALHDDPRFRVLAGYPPPGDVDRVAGWRHDLDFFLAEARRLHADPSRVAHGAAFAARVAALAERVASLDDEAVALELQKIVVTLGDGHSVVYPLPTDRVSFPMLPLSFYLFADGLFVVDAAAPYADLAGSEVVAIGGRSVAGVADALRPYVSRDNDQGLLWLGPRYMTSSSVLRDLGYTDSLERAVLTVVGPDGERRDVTIGVGPAAMQRKLQPPRGSDPDAVPLWLRHVERNYWHAPLPELDALYVQVNQMRDAEGQSIAAFAAELARELDEHRVRRLVVDLRHNNGGNNFLVWPLVRLLVVHEAAGDDHELYVVTGRNTFSAAQNFVNFVERVTAGAVFVGEPSSSRPNFTGEDTEVELPWSGLRLSLSSRYWQDSYPGDRRPYVPVALPVALRSTVYLANRDPVLDALAELWTTDDAKPESGGAGTAAR